jgi:hypothetical protein
VDPAALDHLVNVANGDARALLNALELAVETTPRPRWQPGPDPGSGGGVDPAASSALRQGGGCPLRHHQRLHQKCAGLRPGCRPLLAGPHDLRR